MRGYDAEDSRDLTQSFFTQLLDKNYLKDADQQRGRFRSFLLAALKHFLANEWDRAHAKKRGGESPVISIDSQDGERRYRHEPTDSQTAEKIYDRRWALTLLNQVLMQLEDEYRQADKSRLFECLQSCLQGSKDGPSYAQLADQLGTTEGAIKVAVHRLRRRYRELLTAEIAQTVGSPLEIEEEIRCLFDAVGA